MKKLKMNLLGVVLAVVLLVVATGCTIVLGDSNTLSTEAEALVEGVKVGL